MYNCSLPDVTNQLRSFRDNLSIDNFRFCKIVQELFKDHLVIRIIIVQFNQWRVILTIRNIAYCTMLHDRPVTIYDPQLRDYSSRMRSPCLIRTNGGYDPLPTILVGLKMTDKQLHHLHTWQLALPSTYTKTNGGMLDRHVKEMTFEKQLFFATGQR